MALLAITILFGVSLLAASILFTVVVYDVPQPPRMILKRRTSLFWQANVVVNAVRVRLDRQLP